MEDDRVRTDLGMVAHEDAPQDFGARADVDASPEHRRFGLAIQPPDAERDALPNHAIVPDHGITVNDDAVLMLEDDTPPDTRSER
jgi:hypothetical protein